MEIRQSWVNVTQNNRSNSHKNWPEVQLHKVWGHNFHWPFIGHPRSVMRSAARLNEYFIQTCVPYKIQELKIFDLKVTFNSPRKNCKYIFQQYYRVPIHIIKVGQYHTLKSDSYSKFYHFRFSKNDFWRDPIEGWVNISWINKGPKTSFALFLAKLKTNFDKTIKALKSNALFDQIGLILSQYQKLENI